MFKIISFDIDNTLIVDAFDKAIWSEELPAHYAKEKGISLEKAKEFCFSEYKKHEGHNLWTSLPFWFNKFGLTNWQEIMEKHTDKIKLFPEAMEVLKVLSKKYKLIIITQNSKEFLDLKMKNMLHLFEKVYSSTHHYNSLQKNSTVYNKIIEDLGVKPEEIIHVGDDKAYDYDAPKSVGIKAVLLDRENKHPKEKTIKNLNEFISIINQESY